MDAKGFYLILHLIALRTVSLVFLYFVLLRE